MQLSGCRGGFWRVAFYKARGSGIRPERWVLWKPLTVGTGLAKRPKGFAWLSQVVQSRLSVCILQHGGTYTWSECTEVCGSHHLPQSPPEMEHATLWLQRRLLEGSFLQSSWLWHTSRAMGTLKAIDSGHGLGKKTEGVCLIKPSGAITT